MGPRIQADYPFPAILLTVFTSIIEVFVLGVAGYVLASRGILDKKTQKQLNRLNVSLFTPALLFSKVAFFLTPAKLRELWIIPIFFVIVTGLSMFVGYVLGKFYNLKRSQRCFAMAAAMFMNSNSLPIALLQSMVITVPGLNWGPDDTADAMVGRALTYLVLYSTFGMVVRWSYGVHLLSQADDEVIEEGVSKTATETPSKLGHSSGTLGSVNHERTPLLAAAPRASVYAPENGGVVDQPYHGIHTDSVARLQPNSAKNNGGFAHDEHSPRTTSFYTPYPNATKKPLPGRSTSSGSSGSSPTLSGESDLDEDEGAVQVRRKGARGQLKKTNSISSLSLPIPVPLQGGAPSSQNYQTSSHSHVYQPHDLHKYQNGQNSDSLVSAIWLRIVRGYHAFMRFMTAPLWAALASFIVACLPSVQRTLEIRVIPVKGVLEQLGRCSIPITLIVLGGYFYREPAPTDDEKACDDLDDELEGKQIQVDVDSDDEIKGVYVEDVKGKGKEVLFDDMPEVSQVGNDGIMVRRRAISSGYGTMGRPTGILRRDDGDDSDMDDMESGLLRPSAAKRNASESDLLLIPKPGRSRSASTNTLVGGTGPKLGSGSFTGPSTSTTTLNSGVDLAVPLEVVVVSASEESAADKAMRTETETVWISIVSRMVITPIVLIPFLAYAAKFELHPVFADPIFILSSVLLMSSPSALTLAQITQAVSGDAFERLISRTIFWSYCVVTPPATMVYVILGLFLAKM
ncbi:hypothetical protein BDN72DRAFT_894042 [Pluteus cervinus]|uniref:Uncharacterized protein n=1 Tax=Pluteus cervinus TaxID=181527 RepID=A0ACD3B5Q2_9AGAR|nr:hypothetical protein BDN72DRAFT_894042 [Pluteus cervinus]